MVNIRLPDGQVKQYPEGTTAGEVLADTQSGAQEAAIAARIDGVPSDLSRGITSDCSVEPILPGSEDGLEIMRHSAAHVMAHAVLRLRPDAKLAIGPAIGEGFIGGKACEGIARRPEHAGLLTRTMLIGQAVSETTGIYSLLIAILLILVL